MLETSILGNGKGAYWLMVANGEDIIFAARIALARVKELKKLGMKVSYDRGMSPLA